MGKGAPGQEKSPAKPKAILSVAEWRSNGTGKTGMLEATGTVRR
jgi:hypothetical protein